MTVLVDDPADERVSDFVRLGDPGARRRLERASARGQGFFIAEGPLVIRQLLRSSYRVRSVLVSGRGLRALEPDLAGIAAPVYRVEQPVMDAICGFHFHRGALAAAERRPLPALNELVPATGPVVLVEGVNDHENLGAIFRNAAAFGVGAVVLDPTCADPLYRRAIRVSVGHVLHMPYTRVPDWPGAVGTLRQLGYEVLALTPSRDARDVRTIGHRPRRALLLGSEGTGLSAAALAAADHGVRIAMAPGVDSLNVATAAAVALHQLAPPSGE